MEAAEAAERVAAMATATVAKWAAKTVDAKAVAKVGRMVAVRGACPVVGAAARRVRQ